MNPAADSWVLVRWLNIALVLLSSYYALVVIWRIWPRMEWYRRVFLQGCIILFLALASGTVVALYHYTPYSLNTFLVTLGGTCTVMSSIAWARHLPKRHVKLAAIRKSRKDWWRR